MKSKLFLFCFSLFICSLTITPSEYLSVVTTTTSVGTPSEYTFKFSVTTLIPDNGAIVIQFPKEIGDFGTLPDCMVASPGQEAVKTACNRIFQGEFTDVILNAGRVDANSYIITIPGIVNPLNVTSSGNFRVYTKKYHQVVEESWEFEGIAFTPAPTNLISGDLVQIPPTLMRAPNKFQWQFKTNSDYPAGYTIRYLIPSGFNALRPVCEMVQNVNGTDTISTLFYETSPTNQRVDCLNVPFPITKNTNYKFNLDSIFSPDHAGSSSGFTIQILNPQYQQTMETFTNNQTLLILPQALQVGPVGMVFNRKEDVNITFSVTLLNEVTNPSQLVIAFSGDWTLSTSCQILSGLDNLPSGPPSCVKDGANSQYFITNFAKAPSNVPILIKIALKTPMVGNQVYNVTFYTYDIMLGGKINQAIHPIMIAVASGDAQIFKFFAFSENKNFFPGDSKSLHFSFQLNYTWPEASFTPLLTLEIFPKIADPVVSQTSEMKCLFSGVQSGACTFDNALVDRSRIIVSPVPNLQLQFIYLVISGFDLTTGEEVGLQWPFKTSNYKVILSIRKDLSAVQPPIHVFTSNFSNNPTPLQQVTLTPLILNQGSKTPLYLKMTIPLDLGNGKNYNLNIELNNQIYNNVRVKGPIECLIKSHPSNSKIFCEIKVNLVTGKPLISVYGLVALRGEQFEIYFPKISLKTAFTSRILASAPPSASGTYIAWIEETAPGVSGHLIENFNVTTIYGTNDNLFLIQTSPLATVPTVTVTLGNSQINQIDSHQYQFTTNTIDPDFLLFDFRSTQMVQVTEVRGDYLVFGKLANQIIHFRGGAATGSNHIENFQLPAGYIKNPSRDGEYRISVTVVKNGNIVENFNFPIFLTNSASGTLVGTFGPHASETNILENGNYIFESSITTPAIVDNSCISLKFTGLSLSQEQGRFQTCGTIGFSAFPKAKCQVVNSTFVLITGFAGVSASSNSIQIQNKFKVDANTGISANFSTYTNSSCSRVALSVIVVADAFAFNATVKAGVFEVKNEAFGYLYKGQGNGILPLNFNLNIATATTFNTIAVSFPDCIALPSKFLYCMIDSTAVPCSGSNAASVNTVTLTIGSSLNGNIGIRVSSEFGIYGDGLEFNCDGSLNEFKIEGTTGSASTYQIVQFFRQPQGIELINNFAAKRIVKTELFNKGVYQISFALNVALNPYSGYEPSRLRFAFVSTGVANAFSNLLGMRRIGKVANDEIPCLVNGLVKESNITEPIKCIVYSRNGAQIVEIINFDAVAASTDISITLFTLSNTAYVSDNFYQIQFELIEERSVVNQFLKIFYSINIIDDLVAATTITPKAQAYSPDLAFATGTFGETQDLVLTLAITGTLDIGSIVIIELSDSTQFASQDTLSITCPDASFGNCFVIGTQKKAFYIASSQLTGSVTVTIPQIKIWDSSLLADQMFTTTLVNELGVVSEILTHTYTITSSQAMWGTIDSISLSPFGGTMDSYNFAQKKKNVWIQIEFTVTHGIKAGGSIIISIGETNDYLLHESCSAIATGTSKSALLSALGTSDIFCERLSNTELQIAVDADVAASGVVKLILKIDSVNVQATLTLDITTYNTFHSNNLSGNKLDYSQSIITRTSATIEALEIETSKLFNPDSFVKVSQRRPFAFSIPLTDDLPASSSLTINFPTSNSASQGTGFVFGTTSYFCKAQQNNVNLNCLLNLNPSAYSAVVTIVEALVYTHGSLEIELTGYSSTDSSIGLPFPATSGTYFIEFILGAKSTKFEIDIIGESFSDLSVTNLNTAKAEKTAIKVAFTAPAAGIAVGNIELRFYYKGFPATGLVQSSEFNGKSVDIYGSSSISSCIFLSGSDGDFDVTHIQDRFVCSVGSAIAGSANVAFTVFMINADPDATAPYNLDYPLTLKYTPTTGSGDLFSILPFGLKLQDITTATDTALASFYLTGTTTAATVDQQIDLSIVNKCGDLKIGDSILFTPASFDASPVGSIAGTGVNVKFVNQFKGIYLELTADLANNAALQVGPFTVNNGFVADSPAYAIACSSVTAGKNIFNVDAVSATPFYGTVPTASDPSLLLVPLNNYFNAVTDLIITMTIGEFGTKRIALDLTGLYVFDAGSICSQVNSNLAAIESCSISGSAIEIILVDKLTATTSIGVRTYNLAGSTTNPAAAFAAVNYAIALSALSTGAITAGSVGLIAIQATQAYTSPSSGAGSLADPGAVARFNLEPIYDKFNWNYELNQAFPNCAFFSFALSTTQSYSDATIQISFTNGLYSFNTTMTGTAEYTGSLVCLIGEIISPCSFSTGSITITKVNLATASNYQVYIGFYNNALNGALVAPSTFETLTVAITEVGGSNNFTTETGEFNTNPAVLSTVTIEYAHQAKDALNAFQITIGDTATITTPETYVVVLELSAGSAVGKGFNIDSFGSLYDNTLVGDGSPVPCANLQDSSKSIKCVFSVGDYATNKKPSILIEVESDASTQLKFIFTGFNNPADKDIEVKFWISLYKGSTDLIGKLEKHLFQTADKTTVDLSTASISIESNFYNNENILYTITDSSYNFDNNDFLIYVIPQSAVNSPIIMSNSVGIRMWGMTKAGESVLFVLKQLSGLGTAIATYDSNDFYLTQVLATAPTMKLYHLAVTGELSKFGFVVTTSQAANDLGIVSTTSIGNVQSSVSSSAVTSISASNGFYSKFTLDVSALSANFAGLNIKRGVVVTFTLPAKFGDIDVANDQCWIDNRIFQSSDPANPTKCEVIDTTHYRAIKISSFDSIVFANEAFVLFKHHVAPTGSNANYPMEFRMFSHDTVIATEYDNHFAIFTVDISTTALTANTLRGDGFTNNQLNVVSATSWEFKTTLTNSATPTGTVGAIQFSFDAGLAFGTISSVILDILPAQLTSNTCTYSGMTIYCAVAPGYNLNLMSSPVDFKLTIVFDAAQAVPANFPIFFASTTLTIASLPEVFENQVFMIDTQVLASTIALSSNTDIVSFNHLIKNSWSKLTVKLTAFTQTLDSSNPLAIEIIGTTSSAYTANQEIPCSLSSAGSAISNSHCYFILKRSSNGSPFTNDEILVVPGTSISSGTEIIVNLPIDITTTTPITVNLYSYKRNDNFNFNGRLSYNAFESFEAGTPLPGTSGTFFTQNSFKELVITTSLIAGDSITIDFDNQLTINAGHDLATELSSFLIGGTGSPVAFDEYFFFKGQRTILVGKLPASFIGSSITIISTQDIVVNKASGVADLVAVVGNAFGASAATLTFSGPVNSGELTLTASQILGKLRLNYLHYFKYTFNTGDFDVQTGSFISLNFNDIERFDGSAATSLPCSAFIDKIPFTCEHDRTNSNIKIGSSTSQQKIAKNSVVVVYLQVSYAATMLGEYLLDVTPAAPNNIKRYQKITLAAPVVLTSSVHIAGAISVEKTKDYVCLASPNVHIFQFTPSMVGQPRIEFTSFAPTEVSCELYAISSTAFKYFSPPISGGVVPCSVASNVLLSTAQVVAGTKYRFYVYDKVTGAANSNSPAAFNTMASATFQNHLFTKFSIVDNTMADQNIGYNGPIYPSNPNSLAQNKFYATSRDSAEAKLITFKIPSPDFSGAGTIEIEFLNPVGCSTNCNWKSDQDLFNPQVAHGSAAKCFVGLFAHDITTYNDFSSGGSSPICNYFFGAGDKGGTIKITGLDAITHGDDLTIAIYDVVTNPNGIYPVEITYKDTLVAQSEQQQEAYAYIGFASLFQDTSVVTPAQLSIPTWSLDDANNGKYGKTTIDSSIVLDSSLTLNVGDKILISLPPILSFNSHNLKNGNFKLQGGAVDVIFRDSVHNQILIQALGTVDMSSTANDKDLQFIGFDQPFYIDGCSSCPGNAELKIFKDFEEAGIIDPFAYPTLGYDFNSYSTTINSNVIAANMKGMINIQIDIPAYFPGDYFSRIAFDKTKIQIIECLRATTGASTTSACNAGQNATHSYVDIFLVQNPTISVDFNAIILTMVNPDFEFKLMKGTEAIEYFKGPFPLIYSAYGSISSILTVDVKGKYLLQNPNYYEWPSLPAATPPTTTPNLIFGFAAPFDLSGISTNIVLTFESDIFTITGLGALNCYYRVLNAIGGLDKILSAACVESSSGTVLSISKPSAEVLTGTHVEVVISKATPFSLPTSPNIFKIEVDNTSLFLNDLPIIFAPAAPFTSFSSVYSNTKAGAENYIGLGFDAANAFSIHLNDGAGLSSYFEVEFPIHSFGLSVVTEEGLNHLYFSKLSSTCVAEEKVLFFPGSPTRPAILRYLPIAAVSPSTALSFLIPFITNGENGHVIDFTVKYVEISATSGFIPIVINSMRFLHGTFNNPAALTPIAGTVTASDSTFQVTSTLTFNFISTAVISSSEQVSITLEVGNHGKAIADFCGITFASTTTSFYLTPTRAIWAIKLASNAAVGANSLTAATFVNGDKDLTFDFTMEAYGSGALIQSILFPSLTFTTDVFTFSNTLPTTIYQNSQIFTALTFTLAKKIPANSIITIKLTEQSFVAPLIGGGDCIVISGLAPATTWGKIACSHTAGDTWTIDGYAEVSSSTEVSIQVLTSPSTGPIVFDASISLEGTVLFTATLTSGSVSALPFDVQSKFVSAEFPQINNIGNNLDFTYTPSQIQFQTANPLNHFFLSHADSDVIIASDQLSCQRASGSSWVPIVCSLTSTFTQATAGPLQIKFELGSWTMTAGASYNFRVSTGVKDGVIGLFFNSNTILKPFVIDAYVGTTGFEQAVSSLTVLANGRVVTSFVYSPQVMNFNSTGLIVSGIELGIDMEADDVITLSFPSATISATSLWKEGLNITQDLYTSPIQGRIPCERFWGETHISANPIECHLSVSQGETHIQIQQLSATITATTGVQVIFYGIINANVTAPVRMTLSRIEAPFANGGCDIASAISLIAFTGTSFDWSYTDDSAVTTANNTQISFPSAHSFPTAGAVEVGDYVVLFYPSNLLKIVDPIDVGTGIATIHFPGTNIVTYQVSTAGASATILLSGKNSDSIPLSPIKPQYQLYDVSASTFAGYQILPLQLTPVTGSIEIREREFNSIHYPSGILLPNRTNHINMSIPISWNLQKTQFLTLNATGFQRFKAGCNVTLNLPITFRGGVLPPSLNCELTDDNTNITITPSDSFNSALGYSPDSAPDLFVDVNVLIDIEYNNSITGSLPTTFSATMISFNNPNGYFGIYSGSLDYSFVAHPSFYDFKIGGQISTADPIKLLRFVYLPSVVQTITKATIQLPSNFVPFGPTVMSLQCTVYSDTGKIVRPCGIAPNATVVIDLLPLTLKTITVDIVNAIGYLFLPPQSVAYNNTIILKSENTNSSTIVETDTDKFPPLYRGRISSLSVDFGRVDEFKSRAIFNISTGIEGIAKGYPTSNLPLYSKIFLVFDGSDYSYDLGTGLNDGDFIGCLQVNKEIPVFTQTQGTTLKCQLIHGSALKNPSIIISGHNAIPSQSSNYSFVIPNLEAPGTGLNGYVSFSVKEYIGEFSAYTIIPYKARAAARPNTLITLTSDSAVYEKNQAATLGNFTFTVNPPAMNTGDYFIAEFHPDLFDNTESFALVKSNDTCAKVWTFPSQRTVLVYIVCDIADNKVYLQDVPLQPYVLPTNIYNVATKFIVPGTSFEKICAVSITGTPVVSVANPTYFNVAFDGFGGGRTSQVINFTIGTPFEIANSGIIDVVFPGSNLFGDLTMINPGCTVLTYSVSTCTFTSSGFTVHLNSPANFNWTTNVVVSANNLNYPNGTLSASQFNSIVYYSLSRLDIIYKGHFLVPTFSYIPMANCVVNASAEFNNTLNSGDLRVGVTCPVEIRRNSVIRIGIEDLVVPSNAVMQCVGTNIFLSSSDCVSFEANAQFDKHILVAIENIPISSNFIITIKDIVGFSDGTHNVTVNASAKGFRYATNAVNASFKTNDTRALFEETAVSPQLIISNQNPTISGSYIFTIPHDTRFKNVTDIKIDFDSKYFGGAFSSVSCSLAVLNTDFNYTEYQSNKAILPAYPCSKNFFGVKLSGIPSSIMETDLIVVAIHNLRNPTATITPLFKFKMSTTGVNGSFLLWRKSSNLLILVNTQIKPLLVSNIAATTFNVGKASIHNFTLKTLTDEAGNGAFKVDFDSRFGNNGNATCTSSVINSTCYIADVTLSQSSESYNFNKSTSKLVTVNSLINPVTTVLCSSQKKDLYNFKFSQPNSDTLVFRNFKVLNPKKLCHDYIDSRISVTIVGSNTLIAGVLNKFTIKLGAVNVNEFVVTPTTNKDGIQFTPAIFNFTGGATEINFTILPSAKPQYTYTTAIWSFTKIDSQDLFIDLQQIDLTIDRNTQLTLVKVNPIQEIKFFDIPYYFDFFILGDPAVNLTISVSSLQAEVEISDSSVLLNTANKKKTLSLKVKPLFQGNSILVSFALAFQNIDLFTYELQENNMTILVSNIQTSNLTIMNATASVLKTSANVTIETNQPVELNYIVLNYGAPTPDSSSVASFLATANTKAVGSLKTIQTNYKFLSEVPVNGLIAATKYNFYYIANNGLTKKAGLFTFQTAPLGSAYKFRMEFSSFVNVNTVLQTVSNLSSIPFDQLQVISNTTGRRLQSAQPFLVQIAAIPSPNNEIDIAHSLNYFNTQIIKQSFGSVYPQFWTGQNLFVENIPATIPSFTLRPYVDSYSYYNASISMTMLIEGGVFAIRVKRDVKSDPKFNGNPSGIQIRNKENQVGDQVGSYDYGYCQTQANSNNCTIAFDDFKSDTGYDFYYVPFAKVPYTPPPVGSIDDVRTMNFTTPANPFIEKQ